MLASTLSELFLSSVAALRRELAAWRPGAVRAAFGTEVMLSVALAVAMAHALNLSNTWWAAISGFAVMQSSFSASIQRAVHRVLGTLAGAAVGAIAGPFIGDRPMLFVPALGIMAAFSVYYGNGSKAPYAWLLGGITVLLVTFEAHNLLSYEATAAFGALRVAEVMVGTAACVIVSGMFHFAPAWYRRARALSALAFTHVDAHDHQIEAERVGAVASTADAPAAASTARASVAAGAAAGVGGAGGVTDAATTGAAAMGASATGAAAIGAAAIDAAATGPIAAAPSSPSPAAAAAAAADIVGIPAAATPARTPRWRAVHLVLSLQSALAVAILAICTYYLNMPGFAQAMITAVAVLVLPAGMQAQETRRGAAQKMVQRVIGCVLAGVLAMALLPLAQGQAVPSLMALAFGVWVGCHVQTGTEGASYVGRQFTIAFIMVFVQDHHWSTEATPALMRLSGILAGIAALAVVMFATSGLYMRVVGRNRSS